MNKVILVRYAEIHLKGNNKHFFEKLLLNNIKNVLSDLECSVEFKHTRYIISNFKESETKIITSRLMTVFGIYSYSIADELDTSVENIKNYFKDFTLENTTFRVSVKEGG